MYAGRSAAVYWGLELFRGPESSPVPHSRSSPGAPTSKPARPDQRAPHFGARQFQPPPHPLLLLKRLPTPLKPHTQPNNLAALARPAPPSTSKTRSVTRATIILQTRLTDAYPINYERSSRSSLSLSLSFCSALYGYMYRLARVSTQVVRDTRL